MLGPRDLSCLHVSDLEMDRRHRLEGLTQAMIEGEQKEFHWPNEDPAQDCQGGGRLRNVYLRLAPAQELPVRFRPKGGHARALASAIDLSTPSAAFAG